LRLVVGFINLAGGSASAYVAETKTAAVSFMAADEAGETKCYLAMMADLGTPQVLADLEKPRYVAPTADGRGFLIVDFDGVKRLLWN